MERISFKPANLFLQVFVSFYSYRGFLLSSFPVFSYEKKKPTKTESLANICIFQLIVENRCSSRSYRRISSNPCTPFISPEQMNHPVEAAPLISFSSNRADRITSAEDENFRAAGKSDSMLARRNETFPMNIADPSRMHIIGLSVPRIVSMRYILRDGQRDSSKRFFFF